MTATSMFFRSIGSAVGVAIFGAVANAALVGRLTAPPAGLVGRVPVTEDGAVTARESHRGALPPAVSDYLRVALTAATHQVFVGLVLVAVLALAATALLPRHTNGAPAPSGAPRP